MSKTIGVLGGMGSYATVEFFKLILDQFEAQKEWDYPKIIIDNNPKIPSRTRAVLFNEDSPAPGMIASCQRLEQSGVDFLVIPCNSAHAWYEEVVAQMKIPVLSIIEEVKSFVLQNHPTIKKLGVIAGEVVAEKGLYRVPLGKEGIAVIDLDDEQQKIVRTIIDDVKHNAITSTTKESALKVIDYFQQRGAEGIILGCTELPLVLQETDSSLPLFDSSLILAMKAAELAK